MHISNNYEFSFKLCCQICSREFNDTEILPKIHNCGYSFCAPCMTAISSSGNNSSCPTCYNIVTENPLDNHLLLQEASKMSSFREFVSKHITEVKNLVDLLKTTLSNDADLSLLIEDIFASTEQEIKKVEEAIDLTTLQGRVTNAIVDEQSVTQLSNQLRDGLKMYYSLPEAEVIKYGRITLENDSILFHSVSLPSIPENATLIQDFNIGKANGTFLKIYDERTSHIITFLMELHISNATPIFVKRLSGNCEDGLIYKGRSLSACADTDDYVGLVSLQLPRSDDGIDIRLPEMTVNVTGPESCPNEAIVEATDHGDFKIIMLRIDPTLNNVTGCITQREWNLLRNCGHNTNFRIIDCGLMLIEDVRN